MKMDSVEVLIKQCEAALSRREMRAAVWFGEKSLSLLNRAKAPNKTRCALLFANVLFANAEYLRAHNVLDKEGLLVRYTGERKRKRETKQKKKKKKSFFFCSSKRETCWAPNVC